MTICKIPFSGFYETLHDSELTRALEMSLSDDDGNEYGGLTCRASMAMRWGAVHQAYARQYFDAFCNEIGIAGARFVEMTSPREYNFETDKIFADIPDEFLQRIRADVAPEHLRRVAAEWFTSRDGFSSFYSPNVGDWGALDEWDHNQKGALLQAWCDEYHASHESDTFDQWAEYYMMPDWSGSGAADELFGKHCPIMVRLWNVCDYLRTRESRPRA